MEFLKLCTEINPNTESIICSDGAELILIKNSSLEQLDIAQNAVVALGFELYIERKIGDVIFKSLKKEKDIIYLSYTPFEQCIRLIFKENGVLPTDGLEQTERTVAPLVTQVRNAYYSFDCGMTYVIRTGNGSFVLIDGGTGEYEEADRLWDILNSQNLLGGKPKISAWFITHPHIDHFGGFVKFIDKYGDKVLLEKVAFNWALENMTSPAGEINSLTEFNRVIDSIKDKTQIITPHSGQRFVFGDAVFDVLFVCEDLYPEFIPNLNDTSLVLQMELAGKRILWLGDMQQQGADYMCKRYNADVFKCDIMQVGHHGYSSASDELHRMADPEALLWPCPDFWFPVVRYWHNNEYLNDSPNIKTIFIGGQAGTVLDMTKPIPDFTPYQEYKNGETVYQEKFEGERVIDLNWSCITGGSTGYKAAKTTLKSGECTLVNEYPENYTVCQFVQPGLIELNRDFTLTFSGKLKNGSEKFGLFWDYASPTVFSEEHALWLEPQFETAFSYELKADSKAQKAMLYLNGNFVEELPYNTTGGLYFILKNATLSLYDIKNTKGI